MKKGKQYEENHHRGSKKKTRLSEHQHGKKTMKEEWNESLERKDTTTTPPPPTPRSRPQVRLDAKYCGWQNVTHNFMNIELKTKLVREKKRS